MDKEILRLVVLNHNEIFNNKPVGQLRDNLKEIEYLIKTPVAVVITGHRRVGKSTLLIQIAKTYFKENYYYLDFSDPALKNIDVLDYESLYGIFLKEFGERKAFFFDEIQGKPEWNKFINNLRERGHKCFITGSNAELLSSEISTFLTGRHTDKIIFPFSFKEFLDYKKADYSNLSTTKISKLLNLFDIYLVNGGFPEILIYNHPDLLKEVYNDIIIRDIQVRWNIKEISEIEDLYLYLISNATQEFTYHSLKSKTNIKDPKTIKNYISYITKTYLLYELMQFDYSLKKTKKKIKKIYCIDNGFLTQVGYPFSIGKSRFLENLIFIELKRRNKDIYFYRDKNNLECDFLIIENRKIKEAIQVCYNFSEKNEEREISGLISALKKYKLTAGTIITYDTDKTRIIDGHTIKMVSAFRWLLNK